MEPEVSTRPGALPPATTAPTAPTAPFRRPVPAVAPAGRSPFAPMLLLAIAFVAWLGFQATQQIGERRQLAELQTSLDPQEIAARKVRTSLDAVATSTAKLAADGDASARVIVEELRKRGITINNASGAAKPP